MGLFAKIFGTYSDHQVKKLKVIADKIDALAPKYEAMDDATLRAQTAALKERLAAGETLDDILPDAFAVVREADWRVLGKRPFYVQLIGGIILHQGRIAEMKTGEGKTLVATMPAYLNALTGKGVHIVTVNDYLARRDSEEMGRVYEYLGLKTGLVVHGQMPDEKHAAYDADITYGTNNEFGFDYLRDNMVVYKSQMVQRGHNFAIVDEVDSILIDEARTPLIISGEGEKSTELYTLADNFARTLKKKVIKETDDKQDTEEVADDADYIVDEKAKTVVLTAAGVAKAEKFFNLEDYADAENSTIAHHVNQAIRAHGIMKRDVDYVVKDGEVIIVDAFTGRLMPGRRYNNGLHQAIEAKEHVDVEKESKTLASITFQNYFRLYTKLSGMTGTALTEETEFREIYNLDVVAVPTNRPMIRIDYPDAVYKSRAGKYRAIVQKILECHEKGQPILIGTVSIEKSEELSAELKKNGIAHVVLNAKNHEREAEIVAQAGKFGAVTISTNMAGRGTDIMLGGNPEYLAKSEMRKMGIEEDLIALSTGSSVTEDEAVLEARRTFAALNEKYKEAIKPEADKVRAAGGLFILGTERHESRRIDNQLRGRSGRQGDPGMSKFYISLEDDLMRLFGGDRLYNMVDRLGLDEDTPIDAKILSDNIESAQKRIEDQNFNRRKYVLTYDDVLNQQREVIYKQRRDVLEGKDLGGMIREWIGSVMEEKVLSYLDHDTDTYNYDALLSSVVGAVLHNEYTEEQIRAMDEQALAKAAEDCAMKLYAAREALWQSVNIDMREIERTLLLRSVDEKWMDHLDAMDELKNSIGLNAYAQRNPVTEYRLVGADMFDNMIADIKETTVLRILSAVPRREAPIERKQVAKPLVEGFAGGKMPTRAPAKKAAKVGRNDPCPCGSGKKYKKCCGRNENGGE
ncbi:MAG: preprotein translocase subunit SecA [Clostridiales bacterium]|nr:preprotein translocase subunit SecA [Clostridiales bacterium]